MCQKRATPRANVLRWGARKDDVRPVRMILVGGFLGSGKTTLAAGAAETLVRRGRRELPSIRRRRWRRDHHHRPRQPPPGPGPPTGSSRSSEGRGEPTPACGCSGAEVEPRGGSIFRPSGAVPKERQPSRRGGLDPDRAFRLSSRPKPSGLGPSGSCVHGATLLHCSLGSNYAGPTSQGAAAVVAVAGGERVAIPCCGGVLPDPRPPYGKLLVPRGAPALQDASGPEDGALAVSRNRPPIQRVGVAAALDHRVGRGGSTVPRA